MVELVNGDNVKYFNANNDMLHNTLKLTTKGNEARFLVRDEQTLSFCAIERRNIPLSLSWV